MERRVSEHQARLEGFFEQLFRSLEYITALQTTLLGERALQSAHSACSRACATFRRVCGHQNYDVCGFLSLVELAGYHGPPYEPGSRVAVPRYVTTRPRCGQGWC